MKNEELKPTTEQFNTYQALYDYFNEHLFDGELPGIILNFSRKGGACGFFAPNRWHRGETKTHEISINPTHLASDPFIEVCQTLVHEQAHLWQHAFGKPSRPGYHNHEWAAKMDAVGLMPSSTGREGGAKVGQHMSDYPIEGGRFMAAFTALPSGLKLPWIANESRFQASILGTLTIPAAGAQGTEVQAPAPDPKKKIKYTCPGCQAKAWGKPGLQIKCVPCDQAMTGGGQ